MRWAGLKNPNGSKDTCLSGMPDGRGLNRFLTLKKGIIWKWTGVPLDMEGSGFPRNFRRPIRGDMQGNGGRSIGSD